MTTIQRNEDGQRQGHNPSIWAFILIALGIIWLLFEAKILSGANLVVLFRLWPLVLIAFGLELLFGRRSRSISLLIGGGAIVLLLVLMAVGPALGLAPSAEVKTAQYSEPVGDATAASVNLDLSVGRTTINALSDSTKLIDADLRYVGDVDFKVTDSGSQKAVVLTSKNESVQWFSFLGLSLNADENDLRWNIGLSPNVLLDVHLSGGVGDDTLDMSGLQLSRLSYKGGVGDTTLSLPGRGSYGVDFNGGVGKLLVNFADGAGVNATVDAGVGEITLDVPDDAPVYVEAEGGLGQVHIPSNFTRISGDDDNNVTRNGVWESASYSAASDSERITIKFNGGVGNLNVQ
jgi:hypothetical protein